jgi:hypothetical protein
MPGRRYYSIRMRASKAGHHISGAEGIYENLSGHLRFLSAHSIQGTLRQLKGLSLKSLCPLESLNGQ